MSRSKGKPQDPEQYMKWRHQMIQKYGKEVFAMFDITLPDQFETLRPSEQDAVNNDIGELFRNLNKQYQSENEDFIAAEGLDEFVTDEDWKALNADAPMVPDIHHFKMFRGKNYSLEFARAGDEIHFHFYYPAENIKPREDVYERLEEIMTPIIPRHWRVSMNFDGSVMPHDAERNSAKLGDYPTCSSYNVHFVKGATMENALHHIQKALKAFLDHFIMPQHYIEGMPGL